MYVIKKKTWIEDHYEVEDLYENVIYKDMYDVLIKLKEIAKEENNIYLGIYEGKYTTAIIRRFYGEKENPEFLKLEENYFLFPCKLEVK